MRKVPGAIVMAGLLSATPAAAQTDRPVGVTLGFPAQVGILWHISDRIAIRPEIGFSRGSTDTEVQVTVTPGGGSTRVSTATSDFTAFTTEVNLLLTLTSWDEVRLYAAPSYGYTHNSSSIETSITIGTSPAIRTVTDVSSHGHSGTVSIGAQFTPHERFAIFGEAGLRYSRSRSAVSSITRTSSLGNTGSVGVVVYF